MKTVVISEGLEKGKNVFVQGPLEEVIDCDQHRLSRFFTGHAPDPSTNAK